MELKQIAYTTNGFRTKREIGKQEYVLNTYTNVKSIKMDWYDDSQVMAKIVYDNGFIETVNLYNADSYQYEEI